MSSNVSYTAVPEGMAATPANFNSRFDELVSAFSAGLTIDRINPVSGEGIGINVAAADYILANIGGAFTSGGDGSSAIAVYANAAVTGAAGDTSEMAQVLVDGSITTQGQSETVGIVAGLYVDEPNITVGAGDTVTLAASLYVAGAPTEGSTNAALYVASGVAFFGGNVRPINNDGASLGISGTAFSDLFLASGAVINFAAGNVTLTHASGALSLSASKMFIGGTENGNMTTGLTINQGGADNEAFTLKSSDVATGGVGADGTESDTYFSVGKQSATDGGAKLTAVMEDTATSGCLRLISIGGTADTTKTSAGDGLVTIDVAELDAAVRDNITADGNVLAVKAWVGGASRTVFIIDEDGDFLYDGADGGAFDAEDDVALVRTFALATSKNVLRTEFDTFLKYNEQDLVRLGILGDTIANGGLVNGSQLNRLLVGAVWQQEQRLRALEARV